MDIERWINDGYRLRLIFLIVTIAVTTIVVQYHTTSGTRTFLQFIDASVV